MVSDLLLIIFVLVSSTFVKQAAGFSTSRCQEEQLFKILQDVNSCSEDLRWGSQFCASHAKIESCLKRAFEKCFNNGSAQKLVRGEKVRLRRKIEEEWGNRIQVDELEKLFDGCAYIAPCPPPGLLLNQKLHWLDHVRTDGDCDYAQKAEVLAQFFKGSALFCKLQY